MARGIEYIRKDKYVPKNGDVILNADYSSATWNVGYVRVEREQSIPEPRGQVVIRFVGNRYERPTFATAEAGLWFVYTWRKTDNDYGARWDDFVKANQITDVVAVYRKEL